MKSLLLGTALLMAILASQTASADWGNAGRGGYDGYSTYYGRRDYDRSYGSRYGSRYSSRYGSRFGGSYYSRGWNSHRGYRDRYRGSSINFYYGHRDPYFRGYRRYDAGDFVGGLVVGSLLTSAISSTRYEPPRRTTRVTRVTRPVVRTREVVVVREPSTRSAPVASGRRLLRDLEGNCYERIIDESGDEIRVQLDPAECAF